MTQFFVKSENIENNCINITDQSDIKHITNVLRFNIGDRLVLAGPGGFIYEAGIKNIKHDLIQTEIISKSKSTRKLRTEITLAQSIIKGPKQDIVIQKATELGVKKIIPFISKNTVIKLDSEKDRIQKVERWQKISYEASKQCERTEIPKISHIINISELVKLNDFDVKLACVEKDAQFSIKVFLSQNSDIARNNGRILVITGPEGGWNKDEIELFKNNDIAPVSLGNLILRAETAVITAISDIIYEYEL